MGIDRGVLLHGLKREVFLCNLARNALLVLRGEASVPDYGDLESVANVSDLALRRWVQPRAERRPEFGGWKHHDLLKLLGRG